MTQTAISFTLRTKNLKGKILHTEAGTWNIEELGRTIILKSDPNHPTHLYQICKALLDDPEMQGRNILLLPPLTEFVELVPVLEPVEENI